MIRSIAHPTDLSPQGAIAFEHALSLALACRCRLDVLHVGEPGTEDSWNDFPQVRQVLQRWGVLPPGATVDDIREATGVTVRKVGIHERDPVDGITSFLEEHRSELIVMASHGRAGMDRLLNSSVSAGLAQAAQIPTLILGPAAQPFVDPASGKAAIGRILVPVDHQPDARAAVEVLERLVEGLGSTLDFVHVGTAPPAINAGRTVRVLDGAVVETLLGEARRADLVAMPMAGAQGFVDALRGSTTERVVREVTCPVLALPVAS